MKGQGEPTISVAPETLIKALSFVLFAIIIVMTLVSFQMYQISYNARVRYRTLIDFTENFLSSDCLVYKEGKTLWRGIFDKTLLDTSTTCVNFDEKYYVEIKDKENNVWNFGQKYETKPSERLYYPVLIKDGEKTIPAQMVVETYE